MIHHRNDINVFIVSQRLSQITKNSCTAGAAQTSPTCTRHWTAYPTSHMAERLDGALLGGGREHMEICMHARTSARDFVQFIMHACCYSDAIFFLRENTVIHLFVSLHVELLGTRATTYLTQLIIWHLRFTFCFAGLGSEGTYVCIHTPVKQLACMSCTVAICTVEIN